MSVGAGSATGVRFGQEVQVAVLQESLSQRDPEALRGEGDARHVLEAGQRVALGHWHVEAVHEGGEEQEQLHARQDVSKTHAATWWTNGEDEISLSRELVNNNNCRF